MPGSKCMHEEGHSDSDPLLPDPDDEDPHSSGGRCQTVKDQIVSCMVLFIVMVAWICGMPLAMQYYHARYRQLYTNSGNETTANGTGYEGNVYSIYQNNIPTSCSSISNKTKTHIDDIVDKATSFGILKMNLLLNVPPAFTNLLLGSYSDYYGRKIAFIVSTSGILVKFAIVSVVIRFNLNLNFLLFAFVLEGVSGGYFTMAMASMAYAADISCSDKDRTISLFLRDMSIAMAVTFGQLSTGLTISSLGFFYVCVISMSLLTFALVLIIFGLRETVEKRRSHPNVSITAHLKNVYKVYVPNSNSNSSSAYTVLLCLLSFCLLSLGTNGRYAVETIYQLGPPFCWTALTIGYWGGATTTLQSIVGVGVMTVCSRCVSSEFLAVFGFISVTASLVLEGMASNSIMLYAVVLVNCFALTTFPTIRSIMSRLKHPDQQGSLFAGLAIVDTLSNAAGGAVFPLLYSATLGVNRGIVFFAIAGLVLLSAVVFIFTVLKYRVYRVVDFHVPPPANVVVKTDYDPIA